MKSIRRQNGSVVINTLIILLLIISFVYISGYKRDVLFSSVYKSADLGKSVYGVAGYGSGLRPQTVPSKDELAKFENTPITCSPSVGVFSSKIELARSLFPHLMDIQENTVGSCAIHSIYYSLKDKLGKTELKGGFRKKNIPFKNPDGNKNLSALEKIAKDTGRSIGSGNVTVKQMTNSYKRNGVSKCSTLPLTEKDLVSQCSAVKLLMDAGYDCNLFTYNQRTMLGHIATIDSISTETTSCTTSVYDTTQQDPTKPVGKQQVDMAQGKIGDSLLNISAPFGATMNLDSAGIVCCK